MQVIVETPSAAAVETRSPWVTMWRSPRRTVRRMIESPAPPSWVPVLLLAGISQGLAWLGENHQALERRPSVALMFAVLNIGYPALSLMISPYFFAFVGGWLGAKGDADDVRQALAWTYVPMAVSAVLWLPRLLAYGRDAFDPQRQPDTALQWIAVPFDLAVAVAMIWTIVILFAAISEALQISLARAVAVVAILMVPLLLLGSMA